MSFMIGARHLFYGITMLDRFKHKGWKKPLLIYFMSDETFSVNYTAKIPKGVDKGWFMQKWLYIDPTMDAWVTDENGTMLSIAEVRERLINMSRNRQRNTTWKPTWQRTCTTLFARS